MGRSPGSLEPLPGPSISPLASAGAVTTRPFFHQMAGLLPLLQDSSHRPLTMLWPTDSALQALPPDRQVWLYHKDHRDKLAAILWGHVIRNVEVGEPPGHGSYCLPLRLPTQLQPWLHVFRPWHLTCPTWALCAPCMGPPSPSPAAAHGR